MPIKNRIDGATEFPGENGETLHLKLTKVTSDDGMAEAVLLEVIRREKIEVGILPGLGMVEAEQIQGFPLVLSPQTARQVIEFLSESLESIEFKAQTSMAGTSIEI